MRLWTLHPAYLDAKGLVALWREGLLAKAVLEEKTRGYRNHPQLTRFRAHAKPLAALCEFLHEVLVESRSRHYHFDTTKLPPRNGAVASIEETRGQTDYEWQHLLNKLKDRDPGRFRQLAAITVPEPHPLFTIVPGCVRDWEKRPERPAGP